MNPTIEVIDDEARYVAELTPTGRWESDHIELESFLARFRAREYGYRGRSPRRDCLDDAASELRTMGNEVRAMLGPILAIDEIVRVTTSIYDFWSKSHGWAPSDAAELLARSRLDWQVSLAHALRLWLVNSKQHDADGRLILAWTNLGALVEGAMKWFLCVYKADYSHSPVQFRTVLGPDELGLEYLRQFFVTHKIWPDDKWPLWVLYIQQKRNAIHAYRDRDIGTLAEFYEQLEIYLEFIEHLNGSVPYP